MDQDALERARTRLGAAADGRSQASDADASLARAREQLASLATTAAKLEATLPERLAEALREGMRNEAQPVARQLAELRGLTNQVLGRLERLEGELAAERASRVGDLALLVDLIASGWRGVDERLRRIEQLAAPAAPVYRLGEAS